MGRGNQPASTIAQEPSFVTCGGTCPILAI